MEHETMENELFTWDEWDGDHECMIFYNVVLTAQIGRFPAGASFDNATILHNKGVLQLSDRGPSEVKGGIEVAENIVRGEYKLHYRVGETTKED